MDARFEDGVEKPLNLGALDAEDLKILSALAQDAVFPIAEMTWRPKDRRLAILLNRFRWEDSDAAARQNRKPERVQSVLVIDHVQTVSSFGIDRKDHNTVLSVLEIAFETTDDVSGHVTLVLAGDGVIRATVETLELSLKDVTKPYVAPSKHVPTHPTDT